ncbi:hypothetical protein [Marispirochaeta sp.]|jgi:hypothetical protein|uniref:hypothetical protein n=1 Tax=Marispirochaeta sp. TaxID=2038653 RepID=UPI0029C73FAB|nr:hypothetical protein [Marispirochaeta sp.]
MSDHIIEGVGIGSVWNYLSTPPGEVRLLQFGRSRVWICRRESGWRLALDSADQYGVAMENRPPLEGSFRFSVEPKPEDLAWSNYFVNDDNDLLVAEVSLPDRPIAAQPLESILLPDGEAAQFTTLIPLVLNLKTLRKERSLMKVSSMLLSKNLFGAPDLGEIVYSSPLEVRHRTDELDVPYFCARCDMKVVNISGETLDFSRICIRVEHLGLYLSAQGFITDDIIFSFRGNEHSSSLSFKKKAEGPSVRRVSYPQNPSHSSLIRKSFDFFRNLASYY